MKMYILKVYSTRIILECQYCLVRNTDFEIVSVFWDHIRHNRLQNGVHVQQLGVRNYTWLGVVCWNRTRHVVCTLLWPLAGLWIHYSVWLSVARRKADWINCCHLDLKNTNRVYRLRFFAGPSCERIKVNHMPIRSVLFRLCDVSFPCQLLMSLKSDESL